LGWLKSPFQAQKSLFDEVIGSGREAQADRQLDAESYGQSGGGHQFFDDIKNPILKSFSSTYGKGLAGVVTEFKVDYGEAKGAWGTNGTRFLRAPKFVTINLGMQVIHDIPLGLDANGIMNAPIWSVGNMSRQLGGITEPVSSLQNRSNLEDRTAQLGTFQNPLINRR
jgi:hypothetical protein